MEPKLSISLRDDVFVSKKEAKPGDRCLLFLFLGGLKPCAYRRIDRDIPSPYRNLARQAYGTFLGLGNCFFCQFVGAIASWLATPNVTPNDLIMCLIGACHLAILLPLTFVFWYRPVYNALRGKIGKFYYGIVVACSLITSAMLLVQSLGLPGYTVGVANGVEFISVGDQAHVAAGIYMVATGVYAGVLSFMQLHVVAQMHTIFKETGFDFAKMMDNSASSLHRSQASFSVQIPVE